MSDGVTTRLTISEEHLPNFRQVSPTLYRGGQPSEAGFKHLKRLGVKTVVNLRDEVFEIARESKLMKELGLSYITIPLSPFIAPSKMEIERFLECVLQESNQPLFVHCQHGQDRTGTLVSIYRLHSHEWTIEKAYEEMLALGFHPHFEHLRRTVHEFAKFKGR